MVWPPLLPVAQCVLGTPWFHESKLTKMLGFKGYLPLPLSPNSRSKQELEQPLLSSERKN